MLLSVCLSVCHFVSQKTRYLLLVFYSLIFCQSASMCKNGWTDWGPVCVSWGSRSPPPTARGIKHIRYSQCIQSLTVTDHRWPSLTTERILTELKLGQNTNMFLFTAAADALEQSATRRHWLCVTDVILTETENFLVFLYHFHDYIFLFSCPWGFYLGHFKNCWCMFVCMYVCLYVPVWQ